MAFRKIEALLKMLQFVLFKRNGVQTKSMAGNFYRAFTSQGNSKIGWCIRKLLTLFPERQGNSAKELCNHPGLLVLTNINNSMYWRLIFKYFSYKAKYTFRR